MKNLIDKNNTDNVDELNDDEHGGKKNLKRKSEKFNKKKKYGKKRVKLDVWKV